MKNKKFKIREGVDLYLIGDDVLSVYFMSSRKNKQFKIGAKISKIIELIDGESTVKQIVDNYNKISKSKIDIKTAESLFRKLEDSNIITENTVDEFNLLSEKELNRYDRQINFFGDFLIGKDKKYKAMNKLKNSNILIFGCGAIGGNIAIQLAMSGVENFILYDYDIVEESDISRHIYFKESDIGKSKVIALKEVLKEINSNINVEIYKDIMLPNSNIKSLLDKASFVVNTADEPYIGYTSLKISRYCTQIKKAHFIGGGFDAHLASSGELIIPGITPCVDCYSNHFKEALKGWKPLKHPVIDRHMEIGGLSSMSLFSSSYAAVEIVKYICNLVDIKNYKMTRGEFLFDTMKIDYLNVKRDEKCEICGGIKYEQA